MTIEQSNLLYYLIIIMTVLMVYISEKIRKANYIKVSKIIFWLAMLFPWKMAANRYGIGTDYFNYVSIYNYVTKGNDILQSIIINNNIEPGWTALNFLVKYIFNQPQYVFVISSLLILFFNFLAIYKFRDRINVNIAIFILMCTMYNLSFNLIRQSLAMAILLFSIKYIEERKLFKFTLIVFLAGSFHYTSLIFLPIYLILSKKYNNWSTLKKYLIYSLFILLVLKFDTIFPFLTNIGGGFSKYSFYELNNNSELRFGNIIIRFPIILIILLNYRKIIKKDFFMSQITSLYFISLIISYIGYRAQYIGRIGLLFEMYQILILASIVKIQTNILIKYLIIIIILCYFIILFTYNIVIKNYNETIPYIPYF